MSKITSVLEKLKTRGYRLTRARKSIISIFFNSKTLLTAPEVKSLLERMHVNVNKTTIYREIDFLKDQKMIREINVGDGRRRYEVWSDIHHHHLVCIRCSKVECVDMGRCLKTTEEKISIENNFKIIKHSLKFFGLCARCQ